MEHPRGGFLHYRGVIHEIVLMEKFKNSIKIAELISKSLRGELTGEEQRELERLRQEYPDMEKVLADIRDERKLAEVMVSRKRFDREKTWKGVKKGMKRQITPWIGRVARYAAVLLLPVVFAVAFWFVRDWKASREEMQYVVDAHFESGKTLLELPGGRQIALDTLQNVMRELNQHGIEVGNENDLRYAGRDSLDAKKKEYHRIVVPRGGEYNLQLADGTNVWLFAESELYFPARFDGRIREVYLSGEGYFEVTHDASHPFVVKTKDLDVKVLGTSFNVKAYGNMDVVETSLVEGKVSVKGQILRPNMQAVYRKSTGELSYRSIIGDNYRLRRERMFVFEQERLDDILSEMARWYDFQVFYQNPELAEKRFGFKLQKYEHVETLLHILQLTGEVDFELKDKVLIVKNSVR